VTTSDAYQVMDRAGGMILTDYWHPSRRGAVTAPHLPVGCRAPLVVVATVHLPTGPISMPAVIRMTINEMRMEPRRAARDTVLTRAAGELTG
jgi:hypothetical protein